MTADHVRSSPNRGVDAHRPLQRFTADQRKEPAFELTQAALRHTSTDLSDPESPVRTRYSTPPMALCHRLAASPRSRPVGPRAAPASDGLATVGAGASSMIGHRPGLDGAKSHEFSGCWRVSAVLGWPPFLGGVQSGEDIPSNMALAPPPTSQALGAPAFAGREVTR